MTFKVNDKRHVTPEAASVLNMLRDTDPEKTFQVVAGAFKDYIRARIPKGKDSATGKEWTHGFTIPSPDHALVEEVTRYIVEAILKSADPRRWTMIKVADLRTGDIFTRYQIEKGQQVDEEVTVLSIKPAARDKRVIKFRSPNDKQGELAAPGDYIFYVYRPTLDELRSEMESEAQ